MEKLIELRKKLGLEEGKHDFGNQSILKKLEGDGIEIPANEIINKIRIADGYESFLADDKENLVIVHISDTKKNEIYLKDSSLERPPYGDKGPKFHFIWCSTLEQMVRGNRYEKYVLSRKKDGLFTVQANGYRNKRLENVKLFVCRNCLKQSYYNKYNWSPKEQKTNIVKNFDIGKYIKETEKDIKEKGTTFRPIRKIPEYTSENVPSNDYSDDWHEISQRLKAENNYRCSRCGADMNQKPEGLHVHHKNMLRFDNSRQNLEVLCALCHKEHHPTMYVRPDIKYFIIAARGTGLS